MNDFECYLKVFGFTLRILGEPVKDGRHESDRRKFEFQSSYSGTVIRGVGVDGGETGGRAHQEAAVVVTPLEVRSACLI